MSGGLAAAFAIGAEYESTLDDAARRQGAHYTPPQVAELLVARCFELAPRRTPLRCCDPACGGGVFLVACADALVHRGAAPTDALDAITGIDIDPGAVVASRAALAAWAEGQGVRQPEPRVHLGDGLRSDETDFDVVVGNPPFQGQLAAETARDAERRVELRSRFGPAAGGYVDSAVVFLLAGRRMLAPGGVLCLIQPRSTVAARDAAPARSELAANSVLRGIWQPRGRQFNAEVDVCAPFLTADRPTGNGTCAEWAALLASDEGVPDVAGWSVSGTVGDLAAVTAGFRDEYYGLLGATREADEIERRSLRAVTSGLIDPGECRWGMQPVRFGKRAWSAPVVDVDRLGADSPRVARWVGSLDGPKVLVASQTKVIEAWVDRDGVAVPITPVIAVVPRRTEDVWLLAAAISAPPASAWLHRRRAGSGMSMGSLRVAASDIAALPLPADRELWARVALAWNRGEGPEGVANDATVAYGLDPSEFFGWWIERWPKRAQH